jgi:hypothetical protein
MNDYSTHVIKKGDFSERLIIITCVLIAVLPQVRAGDLQLRFNIGKPGQSTPPSQPTQRYRHPNVSLRNMHYRK